MEAKHMEEETEIRKVKTSTVSGDVLSKFWALSHGKDEERIRETEKLLSLLEAQQLAHKRQSEQTNPLCGDLQYTLTRLVKGLSSSERWARVGFATALTQILSKFTEVKVTDVLTLIEDTLAFTKQESKGEQGNILFGKVTALVAVVQSQRLNQTSGEEIQKVVSGLISLETKRSYLQQPCLLGLKLLINSVDKATFRDYILPEVKEKLSSGWEGCSPETLLLLLVTTQKGFLDKTFVKNSWGRKNILDKDSWTQILPVLISSTINHPIIHQVNEVIVEQLTASGHLQDFWTQVPGKFLQSGKPRLIYLGLYYLKNVISTVTSSEQFQDIISSDAIVCINRNLAHDDPCFQDMARSVEESIVGMCSSSQDGSLLPSVIRQILSSPMKFTDSSFMRNLITKLSPEGAAEFSADLMKIVIGQTVREDAPFKEDRIRKWAASNLKFLVTQPGLLEDGEQLLNILEFLCLHSFFNIEKKDKHFKHVKGPISKPLPDHVRTCIVDCFFGAINFVNAPDKAHNRDFTFCLDVVHKLTNYAKSLLSTKAVSLVKPLPDQVEEELQKALDAVEKIRVKKNSNTPESQAFQTLFLYISLQLFVESKEAMDILKDLHVCYEKSGKKSKKEKKGEEEPEWMEVLTELLLSMMSQSSRLTRNIARSVFRLLSQHVTKNSLDLIINVLHPEDDGEEGPIAFEDKMDDSDIDDDKKGQNSHDAPVNGNHGDDSDDDDEDDDDDDDDENESDQSGEDEEISDQLRETVKAALGPAAADSEKEEESDDDMGDDEMFRLDDALSEAFRSMQRGKSKEIKHRKQQVVTFKLRTLDLVETFVKTYPPAGLVVHLVSPILDLMESGLRHKEEAQLGKRATALLHLIINKLKKSQADPTVDKDEILEKMEELFEYSTKVSSLHMVKEVSVAFLFLMRVVLNLEPPSRPSPVKTRKQSTAQASAVQKTEQRDVFLEKVLDLLKKGLSDCLNKKDCRLHHSFFCTIIERYWWIMWPLSNVLLECIRDESVRVFLRTQACSMLASLMKPHCRLTAGEEKWLKFATDFTDSVSKILHGMEKEGLKQKHTQELLVLVQKFGQVDEEHGKDLVEDVKEKLKYLKGAMNGDCKKVCNKLLSKTEKVSSKKTKVKKKKRKAERKPEADGKEDVSPAKVKKLMDNSAQQSEEVGTARKEEKTTKTNGQNGDILSDSTVTSSLSEASGEVVTPKKKGKRKSVKNSDEAVVSEDSVTSTSVTKRKKKLRTPAKKAAS